MLRATTRSFQQFSNYPHERFMNRLKRRVHVVWFWGFAAVTTPIPLGPHCPLRLPRSSCNKEEGVPGGSQIGGSFSHFVGARNQEET